jgi:hypothetical protein
MLCSRCGTAIEEGQAVSRLKSGKAHLRLTDCIANLKVRRAKPPPTHAPIYAAMYPTLAEIARLHGYALAIHGSLQRDFDLVAIPWVDDPQPSDPEVVVAAMEDRYVIRRVADIGIKPHGRIAYTLSIQWGDCAADLSFMPRVARQESKP